MGLWAIVGSEGGIDGGSGRLGGRERSQVVSCLQAWTRVAQPGGGGIVMKNDL